MRAQKRTIILAATTGAIVLLVVVMVSSMGAWRRSAEAGPEESMAGLAALGEMIASTPTGPRSFGELLAGVTPDAPHWMWCAPNPFADHLPEGRRYGRIWWLLIEGESPENVPLMWDEQPDAHGETAVLFYNGRCERMAMRELDATIDRTSWLPAGPDGTRPEQALVKDERRPQDQIDAEVAEKRWAFAGMQKSINPPNVYRPAGRPPDWPQVLRDGIARHPEAMFAVIGMTKGQIGECLGVPPFAPGLSEGDEPLFYPYRVYPPEYDGMQLTFVLQFEHGRCVSWFVDD